MALQATVIPGQTFTDGDPVTSTEMNNGANPTVTIEDGTITSALLDIDEVVNAISPSLETGNYLPWGSFQQERFIISGKVSCANLKRTPVHPGWYVLPDGIAVDAEASLRANASESVALGRAAIKVFGNSSLTCVNVGTYLPPGLAQMLYTGDVTFSCHIWNNTGAAFTPTLELYAGPTAGDEGDVSIVGTGTVVGSASCPNSEWKRVVWTFAASAVTNFVKGCHVRVKVTKASNVMDDVSDYFLLADAQIDPGVTTATTLKRAALPLSSVPPGCVMPWLGTSSTVPQGWLFCNGAEANRQRYAALFAAIGEAYGAGDSYSTFLLPDLRGRMLVGVEVPGFSNDLSEVSVTVASSSGDTLTVASGAAAGLRLGMGAFNGTSGAPGSCNGQTIIALTDTTIQLSASVGTGISGAVRFSKLGAVDAQTLGAAGAGLSGKRRRYKISIANCSVTNGSPRITAPGSASADKWQALEGVVSGMLISDGASGFASGTTVAGFSFWTGSASTGQVVASTNYTGTTGTITLTFELDCPEGDESRLLRLAQDEITLYDVEWYSGSSYMDIGTTSRIFPGMVATHEAGGGTGWPAGTQVVADVTSGSAARAYVNGSFSANATGQTVKFTRKVSEREATAQAPPTPGMLPVNYIIKV